MTVDGDPGTVMMPIFNKEYTPSRVLYLVATFAFIQSAIHSGATPSAITSIEEQFGFSSENSGAHTAPIAHTRILRCHWTATPPSGMIYCAQASSCRATT